MFNIRWILSVPEHVNLLSKDSWRMIFLCALHIMKSVAGPASENMSKCQRPALVSIYTEKTLVR